MEKTPEPLPADEREAPIGMYDREQFGKDGKSGPFVWWFDSLPNGSLIYARPPSAARASRAASPSGAAEALRLADELKVMLAEETGITGGSFHARINKLAALAAAPAPQPPTVEEILRIDEHSPVRDALFSNVTAAPQPAALTDEQIRSTGKLACLPDAITAHPGVKKALRIAYRAGQSVERAILSAGASPADPAPLEGDNRG